jgi:hypothetical protein
MMNDLRLFFPFTDDDALHSHMRLLIIIITTITIYFFPKQATKAKATNIVVMEVRHRPSLHQRVMASPTFWLHSLGKE